MEIDDTQTSPEYYMNKAEELTDKFRVGFTEWPNKLPEAFELFKEFYARKWLLIEISGFLDKFHSWNERAMNEELTEIKQFISKTSDITLETAFKDGYLLPDQKERVYLRLDNDYYINKKNIQSDCSVAEIVYGRYFLFKDLLDQKLKVKSEKQELPRLQTNLTDTQRGLLFDLLVKGEFIPDENKDCFNWALKVTDEGKTEMPNQWQSIKWNESKMAFVELFRPYINTLTSRPMNRDVEKLFLDKFGDAMKNLKSPGKDEVSGRWSDICTIIEKLEIGKKPHTTNQL